jgi:hypothetical protein
MVLTETRKGKEEGWFKEAQRIHDLGGLLHFRGPRQPVIAIKNTSPFLADKSHDHAPGAWCM